MSKYIVLYEIDWQSGTTDRYMAVIDGPSRDEAVNNAVEEWESKSDSVVRPLMISDLDAQPLKLGFGQGRKAHRITERKPVERRWVVNYE